MNPRLAGAGRVTAAVAVAAGLVVGASQVPSPALDLSTGASAPPASTRPVASAQLVCPGPETIGGESTDRTAPAPAMLSAAASPASLTGSAAGSEGTITGTTVPAGEAKAARLFASPTASGSLSTAASVQVSASGAAAAGLAADQVTLVPTGDLRGLSGAACVTPATDAWLVGGGGEPGRRGRIVLTNIAANAVDVTLHVLSADGPVDSTAGADVAVPAHGRATVLLGALAPSVTSPVVHVSTSGGAVAATLHDARLQGTTAFGTDDVAAGVAPSRSVLVPGVAVDGAALVRIGVPGADEAVAEVRLLGPDGEVVAPDNGVVRVPAGSTRDLDLSDLPAGVYGVEVTADVPIVAGAMVERRRDAAGVADLAWLSSSSALDDGDHVLGVAGASVGQPLTATLALTAPKGDVSVQVVSGAEAVASVQIAAGTTQVVPIPADQATFVRVADGSGPVVAARLLVAATEQGDLVTGSSLRPAPVVQHLTALAPGS